MKQSPSWFIGSPLSVPSFPWSEINQCHFKTEFSSVLIRFQFIILGLTSDMIMHLMCTIKKNTIASRHELRN